MMSLFKPIAFLSAFVGFTFFQQATAQYAVNLPSKNVTVENFEGKAVFSGTGMTTEPGKPGLPRDVVTILLPPDVDFKSVKITLDYPKYTDLGETFVVDPPEFFTTPEWPDSTKIVDGKDTTIYRKDTFYPSSFKGKVYFDQLWHYKMVCVSIYPYRYNPVQKTLRKLTGGVINVSFKTKSVANLNSPIVSAENNLRSIVANPEVLALYGTASSPVPFLSSSKAVTLVPQTHYAIITTNAIYSTSACQASIDAYKTHLQGNYTVEIVTEGAVQGPNTWLSSTDANQRGLNIRQWLKTYVSNVWYVLLIGNPDPLKGDVPMAKMGSSARPWGTDYYYGDLTCNWQNEDGHQQEIAIGRIPVYGASDYPRLNDFLEKTITYETTPDIEWRKFALIPIMPCFQIENNDFDVGETGVKAKLDPFGWECRRLYEPYSFPPSTYTGFMPWVVRANPLVEVPFCVGKVLGEWNKYTPGLVVWHTHGDEIGASGVIHREETQGLNHDRPAIVFSGSCLTAHAQTEGNLGTEVIYNNAIAFIGGTEDLGRDHIHHVVPLFVEKIRDNMSIGDAMKVIRSDANYESDNKMLALYGCPEVYINLNKLSGPTSLTATMSSSTQIDIDWDDVTGVESYSIERAHQVSNRRRVDGWSLLAQIPGPAPASAYHDNTVTADNVYLYRVKAQISGSNSGYSPVDSASTFSSSLLPQPPTNVQATGHCYSATITWDPPSTVQPGTYYNIKRQYYDPKTSTWTTMGVVENTFSAMSVYEEAAEDATRLGNASFSNNHNNFIGSGFVDGLLNTTGGVEFTVEVPVAGEHKLWLFYSAGNGTSTNMRVYINGSTTGIPITCNATGNWDNWALQEVTVTLNAGNNTVKYETASPSTACINLDHLSVRPVNYYIDRNLLNGDKYRFTVSTVNNYGKDATAVTPSAEVITQLQPVATSDYPTYDRVSDITCNSFGYWWHNRFETARYYNEVEYHYDQNIANTLKHVEGNATFRRYSTMYALSNLDNNQTVYFRFRAGNEGEGNVSGWSNWANFTTPVGTPPGPPQNVTLTQITPTTVQLSYTPASSGMSTDGYQLYHKNAPLDNPNDPAPFSLSRELTSTETTIDFPASEGQIDSFTIRAFHGNTTVPPLGKSYSQYTSKMFIRNGYWPVNAPYLTTECISSTEIVLTWEDNSAGEVGFRIERRVNQGAWQFFDNAAANATSYSDNTVAIDNDYEYRVRATCVSSWWPGYSDWSSSAVSTKIVGNIPQVYIYAFNFESFSPNSINIKWGNTSSQCNVTSYEILMSSDYTQTKPDPSTFTTLTTVASTVTSFLAMVTPDGIPLGPDKYYWFGVKATNWTGISGDMAIHDSPARTAPSAPSNLTAVAVNGNTIFVSWIDNSINEEEFGFEYTLDPPNWTGTVNFFGLAENTTSINLDYLEPNKKYWFRVKATNNMGSSAYSNAVSVTTPNDPCVHTFNSGKGLSGLMIGVAPPISEGREYCKATDGEIATFYTYSKPNGAYTGLRFQYPRSIAKIRYYPRVGHTEQMVGGVFQGATQPDFSDAVNLHTVPSTLSAGWNEVNIQNPTPAPVYDYVRYLGPNGSYGNIAEMEFYEVSNTYTISPTAGTYGTITPGSVVSAGSHTGPYTFSIQPNSLCKIADVQVDYQSIGAVSTYTFNDITENHTINAIFSTQTKYEAENASLDYGATVNTNHSGFSGTGFVEGFWNDDNAQVLFTTNTEAFGNYLVKIRYSAGNGTSNSVGFYVNGTKIKNITCPSTGNWETWSVISETVQLSGGFNTIQIKSEFSSSYCINLDYIELINASPKPIYTTAESNGSISPSDNVEVPYGGSQTFTITPEPFYQIKAVEIDGTNVGSPSSYTFSNVTKEHSILASFEPLDRYEAENALRTGGASVNTNHTGYSGTGFVDGFWKSSTATVTFNVNCLLSGSFKVKARYSAGGGTCTNVGFYVDGVKIKNLTFPGTGNWDTWGDVSEFVELTYGTHNIGFKAESTSGNPVNLDYLTADYAGVFSYEAEDASKNGTAHLNNNHLDYSGYGFVDGFTESDNAGISFAAFVMYTGTYAVKLRYSAGHGTSTNVGLYVGDVKIKNITCPGTTDWDTWAEITETVPLDAVPFLAPYSNLIIFKAEASSSACINFDKISLSSVSIITPADIKVSMRDQTLGNNQQSQPRFFIENTGTAPLSNFTMKYYFTVENGKTPRLEKYYYQPYCDMVLSQISGNDYCIVITFPGTLAAGGRIPSSDGLNFALHYDNYTTDWNQSNDYSQPTSSGTYTPSTKVVIFNSSNQLIYGTEP
jgi:hypothetical protein